VLPAISDSVRLHAFFSGGRFPPFASLEQFLDADPTAYVSAATPPFLVLIAEAEQINPPILERAQRFAARMTATGRQVQVEVLANRRHLTALTNMVDAQDPALQLVSRFVQRVTTGD
jgi:acetyl esterase/lipase